MIAQHSLDISTLKVIAHELRRDVLDMLAKAWSGHIGGAFWMADIFTVLYFSFLTVFPENPNHPDRDFLLLSNGHICPIWYATLSKKGFFPREELWKLRKIDALLQWHPKRGIPGVENASGPLWHWLSQAVGIALGLQMQSKKNTVVCCMSDGEHQEWQTWEAIMAANKFRLQNLIAIVDCNGLQIEGKIDEIMPLGNLAQKYRDFGWIVYEIDGHDFEQIRKSLQDASYTQWPCVILASTTLGKGVSFMENNWKYHDWPWKQDDIKKAQEELN